MSLHSFETILADEVKVQVYFEYIAEENPALNYPGYSAEYELQTVLVDDNKVYDVLYVLNDDCVSVLEKECEQYLIDQHEG